jgi:hypothetical protein
MYRWIVMFKGAKSGKVICHYGPFVSARAAKLFAEMNIEPDEAYEIILLADPTRLLTLPNQG